MVWLSNDPGISKSTLVANAFVVLVAIYLVSSTIMRSAAGGLYVVCPIVVTIVLLFGTLGWTGVRFDMAVVGDLDGGRHRRGLRDLLPLPAARGAPAQCYRRRGVRRALQT
jgi:hypothetical protein